MPLAEYFRAPTVDAVSSWQHWLGQRQRLRMAQAAWQMQSMLLAGPSDVSKTRHV